MTSLTSPEADRLVGVESPFTGEGSLGSGWLLGYEDERGLGYLNGVTAGVADTGVSPYFDTTPAGVYKAASVNWTGRLT
ncbi:hypothetical protein ACFYUK_08775 [Nonomuraea wenchangensis]